MHESIGSTSDVVQIESITVSPDPPKPGEDLTVTVKGTAQENIEVRHSAMVRFRLLTSFQEGAYADVTVKLGLIKLLHKEFDICEEA